MTRLAGASARVTTPPRESRNERRGREAPSPHGLRVENKGALLRDSLHAPPVIPGEGSISGRNVRVHASACEVLPKQVSSAHVGFVTDSLMACCKRTAIPGTSKVLLFSDRIHRTRNGPIWAELGCGLVSGLNLVFAA